MSVEQLVVYNKVQADEKFATQEEVNGIQGVLPDASAEPDGRALVTLGGEWVPGEIEIPDALPEVGDAGNILTSDGENWSSQPPPDPGIFFTVQATAPSSPADGDYWLDTKTNQLKRYITAQLKWYPLGTSPGDGTDFFYDSVAIGNVAHVAESSVVIGENAQTSSNWAVAVGREARTSGDRSTALGAYALAAQYAVAIGSSDESGQRTNAVGTGDVSIGRTAGLSTSGGKTGRVSIGHSAKAGSHRGVAIGYSANVNEYGDFQIAIGASAYVDSYVGGIAIGYAANAGGFSYPIAIGYEATATASCQTMIKNDVLELEPRTASTASTIVVKSPNGTRWRIAVDNAGALTAAPA